VEKIKIRIFEDENQDNLSVKKDIDGDIIQY
jgi:D-Tyr-tRNAtyr deacylase